MGHMSLQRHESLQRAQTREGLCIMQPVTIDNLNRPLPYDLLQEMKQLTDLEHNTYI
jgi:hypothetical protein